MDKYVLKASQVPTPVRYKDKILQMDISSSYSVSDIDPEIRELVFELNYRGYTTMYSDAGHPDIMNRKGLSNNGYVVFHRLYENPELRSIARLARDILRVPVSFEVQKYLGRRTILTFQGLTSRRQANHYSHIRSESDPKGPKYEVMGWKANYEA